MTYFEFLSLLLPDSTPPTLADADESVVRTPPNPLIVPASRIEIVGAVARAAVRVVPVLEISTMNTTRSGLKRNVVDGATLILDDTIVLSRFVLESLIMLLCLE